MVKMNKKGSQGYEIVNTIPRMIYTVICIAIIVLMVKTFFLINDESTLELEIDGISERLYFTGLAYIDPVSERIYPGEIDLSKFNEDYIKNTLCYDKQNCETNKHVALKINLTYSNQEKIVIINKREYRNWKVLADSKLKGFGKVEQKTFTYPVIVKTKNENQEGIINTNILMIK